MAAGSISLDGFNSAITAFVERSKEIGDTWLLESIGSDGHCRYLCKKTSMMLDAHSLDDEIATCLPTSEDEEDGDTATLEGAACRAGTKEVSCWEYHVLYSPSYGVPVLYFNVYQKDGGLFSLEEVWRSVPSHYQHRLEEERWSFITQQEHPLLRRPFFQLHPCHTSVLMGQVCGDKDQPSAYLVSWLSTVGPVVRLHLSTSYATMSLAPPGEEPR